MNLFKLGNRYNKEIVYLIVSIDVEEDDWGVYKREDHHLTNLGYLPRLQKLFDSHGIKPTYLIDYPVAADQTHRDFFKTVHDTGRAEVGAHLHPWNTPPFEEELSAYNSMTKNLPHDLQKKKITVMTDIIEQSLGFRPVSFRTGRFGVDQQVLSALIDLNYAVDSSVTPFVNWEIENGGTDFYGFPHQPYEISLNKEISTNRSVGTILEVPATIGFNRSPFTLWSSVYRVLSKESLRAFRLRGFAHRLGLLKRILLCPEMSACREMKQLAKVMIRSGDPVLNLFFHSTSLAIGLSPFVKTIRGQEKFFQNLELFFAWLYKIDEVKSVTLSEYYRIYSERKDKYD